MWGNATGWTIAAILLMFLALAMNALIGMGNISDPTPFGTNPANLGAFALPTAPSTVLPMNDPADASAQYRAALDDAMSNADAYRNAMAAKNASDIADLSAIGILLSATNAHSASIFANHPTEIITFAETPKLDMMLLLGHLLGRAGLIQQLDDPAKSIPYFQAEFALGCRLYAERLTTSEFTAGFDLFAESAGAKARVYSKMHQPDRANATRQFDADRLHFYNERVLPMLKAIRTIDPATIADHAGDVFYFSSHAHERMWRIESIFALGRMRYFVGNNGRVGDQRGATRVLKKLSQDADPYVQQAAITARDLTIEQYRGEH